MQGCIHRWTVSALAVFALAAMSSMADAQMLDPDPGYQALNSPNYQANNSNNRFSNASLEKEQAGLAEEVAELRAWKESVEKKEAEAKKKADGAPTVQVGGRILVDTAMFGQNDASLDQVGNAENGTEMRSARIFLKGTGFHVMDYKFEVDFASRALADLNNVSGGVTLQQTAFKDAYMGISELPLIGHVRVGHFKEPFSMEQLESSLYTTFMERSLGDTGIFVPGRNIGAMAFNTALNERMTWATGVFTSDVPENPPFYQDDSGTGAVTSRITFLPWYDEATEGRGLWHIGAGYSYRQTGYTDTLRLRSKPESNLGPYVLDTGTLVGVPDHQLYNIETALLLGSFCMQAEYFGVTIDRTAGDSQQYNGGYVDFSYFLTGENRVYNKQAGCFNTRVKPHENFFRVRDENGYVRTGWGAWEIAYRFSNANLIDDPVNGGRTNDNTFGVNWYLNPYMRMMFNYIHSTTDDADADNGVINIVQMRAQVDF